MVEFNETDGDFTFEEAHQTEQFQPEHSTDLAPSSLGAKFTVPAKPLALPVRFDTIPDALKEVPNWLLWKYEPKADWNSIAEKGGKPWTKVPHQPNGHKASVINPTHWSDYQDVRRAYEAGGYDGIGFVLTLEQGIVGVDMDNQLTEKVWRDAVNEQISSLQTYGEISPSGQGLRFFGFATLPPNGRKRGDFEIYDGGRFLTVTGHQLDGTPDTVNECEAGISDFYGKYIKSSKTGSSDPPTTSCASFLLDDDKLLQIAMNAKNGAKFKRLWDGETVKGLSEDDAALCFMLAFWTRKNPELMERLLRKSKRERAKWDDLRGETTWIGQEIENAIERCGEVYEPKMTVTSSQNDAWTVPSDIPSPIPCENGKSIYSVKQIKTLIYPGWNAMSLDTNTAHSERLVKHLGDDLRYARGLGWFVFGGRYWIQDDKEASQTAHKVKSLAQMFTLETNRLYEIADALECQNRESDAKAMKQAAAGHLALARKTESKRFIKDTLDLSAGAPAIRVEPPKFDVKPFVLGFENGVWDCGHWREHRREDYMMRLCPVVYDPDVDRVEWNAVLNRMTKGDVDFQRTLQDVAGYCLSGSSNLRCLPWFYGEKATGKSTFTELLQTVAGPLSATIDPLKFGEKADRDRLGALLWNCLVAVCGEAGNKKIDPELLKTLSGSDRLTVRHLYNEAFDAVPRHVLIMVSNDSPRLDAYDEALKDRILVLPFEHRLDAGGHLKFSSGTRIESVRKDPESLLVRGFLAWAIEGLARVFQTPNHFRISSRKRGNHEVLGGYRSSHPLLARSAQRKNSQRGHFCFGDAE